MTAPTVKPNKTKADPAERLRSGIAIIGLVLWAIGGWLVHPAFALCSLGALLLAAAVVGHLRGTKQTPGVAVRQNPETGSIEAASIVWPPDGPRP